MASNSQPTNDTNGANGTNGDGANGINDANGANGHNVLPALCQSAANFLSHEYDFIVVGGGTAGLVVAARLTENPDVTVGVLEAGPSRLDDPLVNIPAAFLGMLGNPEYDWCLKSTPQHINKDIVHHFPRGKMLGGSSGINYMMYVRGSDADYDDWAEITGDDSWSSKAMKKYMRKHQTLEPVDPAILDKTNYPFVGEHHGTKGPIHTSFNDTPMPLESVVIEALEKTASIANKPLDPWSGDHVGFYNSLGFVARTGPHKGQRSYSANAYFAANATRPNLKVLCEASVDKITLNGNTASGIDFTHAGQKHHVDVGKEAIVSGGTIHSPQLLELSGIGDPDILRAAGVDCHVELRSVGQNLQDHLLTAAGYELKPGMHSADIMYNPETAAVVHQLYAETKGGPVTSIAATQGFYPYKGQATAAEFEETIQSIRDTQAHPKTSAVYKQQLEQVIKHLENDKSGDLSLYLVPLTANFETGVQTQHLFPPVKAGLPHQITFASGIQYPVARGSIHISNSDISTQPTIEPAYLTHSADVDLLATALRFLDRMAQFPSFQQHISRRVFPAPHIDLQNREQAVQAAKDWIMTTYHPIGTCAMGDVVDSRLRVNGVKGLRVVDASVFPNNISGNICSSVYMVAERGADIIKEDYGYPITD